MDQDDIDNIFQLHILLFGPPVDHNEENDINRDDFPGIVVTVEFEDEQGLLMHVEVRLPRYMTAFNPSIGLTHTQRALRELLLYQWTPDTEYSPLVSMLTWQTDVWGVTVHAAGESSTLGFYPLYNYNPPAAREEIPMDDEQPGPSHQVNGEASPAGSRAPADHSSDSQVKSRQGGKRKRKTSGRSESREWKRTRSDHQSDSSFDFLISGESLGETSADDDQPGFSHRDNREARARGSRALTDQSSQDEMSQGGKRKSKAFVRSESREGKQRRSDHLSDSDSSSHSSSSEFYSPALLGETSSHDDLAGPSHQEAGARASSAPAGHSSRDVSRFRGVRKKKISERSNTQIKRSRSDPLSDSSCDSSGFYGPDITFTGNHVW